MICICMFESEVRRRCVFHHFIKKSGEALVADLHISCDSRSVFAFPCQLNWVSHCGEHSKLVEYLIDCPVLGLNYSPSMNSCSVEGELWRSCQIPWRPLDFYFPRLVIIKPGLEAWTLSVYAHKKQPSPSCYAIYVQECSWIPNPNTQLIRTPRRLLYLQSQSIANH